jgi:hypothetical protein
LFLFYFLPAIHPKQHSWNKNQLTIIKSGKEKEDKEENI